MSENKTLITDYLRTVSAGLIVIYRIQNRKIVSHWMQFDMFALLQQLQGADDAVSA